MPRGQESGFRDGAQRNQSQLVFFPIKVPRSRSSAGSFSEQSFSCSEEEVVKNECTVTNHNQELLPGIISIVSEEIQNDKLQWDPSRDGHPIKNELEPIPPRSEPPLISCSNVQTDGIEAVEMSLVSVVLEEGDGLDVYVPLKKSIEEPEPSPPQTVEVAIVPEVSEMIVLSQRDDSTVRELRQATCDGSLFLLNTTHKTLGMKHSPEISSQSGSSTILG